MAEFQIVDVSSKNGENITNSINITTKKMFHVWLDGVDWALTINSSVKMMIQLSKDGGNVWQNMINCILLSNGKLYKPRTGIGISLNNNDNFQLRVVYEPNKQLTFGLKGEFI